LNIESPIRNYGLKEGMRHIRDLLPTVLMGVLMGLSFPPPPAAQAPPDDLSIR